MSFFNFFSQIVPSVKAQDDEDELVDPQVVLKEECGEKCTKYKDKLDSCNERVSSRSQTTETCLEELIDFVHCVDHCVAKDIFSKLK
ncbi:cytochrome b-c1 complex subunit 6, mitochondrial [Halyomorpha halys]|uniref:cytochrome b-c1 complex subunit 6, mitochondrial n=1 Tax=Halyomorpha halys TaxID=286706 RepID=UPI0006D4C96B|nr:cytochrome b-c1 complex subunit 6, mitochondrial-like [Halyomorpha halys]